MKKREGKGGENKRDKKTGEEGGGEIEGEGRREGSSL